MSLKNNWIDKNQRLIYYCLAGIMLALFVLAFLKTHETRKIEGYIFLAACFLLMVQTGWHYIPVRVVGEKIILAQNGFFQFGRRAVLLSELKNIRITPCKKWDEGGRPRGIYGVIRAESQKGAQYRNMIYSESIKSFKAFLSEKLPASCALKDLRN